jgi:hypothetical protein
VHIAGRHDDDDVSVCPVTRDFWAETKDARGCCWLGIRGLGTLRRMGPYGECNGMDGAAVIPMLMNVGYRWEESPR